MPERSKDWINQAEKDLKTAEELIEDDKYYVPTRYPNSFESGSPYEYFTRRDAENGIVCSRRIIEFCKGILA